MQQVPAWARRKTVLFAAGAVILGTIILTWSFVGRQSDPAPATVGALALTGDDSSEFGATTLNAEQAPQQTPKPDATPTAEFAIVYVSGAVLHPDVYRVPVAARVKDVVLAAGGLADDADVERINLADRVVDAQHIHIPRQGEPPPINAPADTDAPASEQRTLLNINTAGTAELDSLPGIGQSFAQRIVEYRTANGPFQSVDDLGKVKGIGPALLAKIAPLITVGP